MTQPQDAREKAYSKAAEEFYDERGLVVVPGYESEAFRKGFDAGHNAARRDDWVRVDERLPEKSGRYEVTLEVCDPDSDSDTRVSIEKFDATSVTGFSRLLTIIAWRELSEPYTAGDENQ